MFPENLKTVCSKIVGFLKYTSFGPSFWSHENITSSKFFILDELTNEN